LAAHRRPPVGLRPRLAAARDAGRGRKKQQPVTPAAAFRRMELRRPTAPSAARPAMTEETLFNLALEKPSPEERAAFLDQACAGRPRLRAAVEALLRAHEGAG